MIALRFPSWVHPADLPGASVDWLIELMLFVSVIAVAQRRGTSRLQAQLDRDASMAAMMSGTRVPTDLLVRNAERHRKRFACRNDAGIIDALIERLNEQADK